MSLDINLPKVEGILKGRKITDKEIGKLTDRFDKKLIPPYLLEILKKYNIIGQEFSMTEEEDPSEIGVEMEWMTPEAQIDGSTDYEPCVTALRKGFLLVGLCLTGSGDPYFIKKTEGKLKVFRVPLEAIENEELDVTRVEFICNLAELFLFLKK